jgi:hypothetical protein
LSEAPGIFTDRFTITVERVVTCMHRPRIARSRADDCWLRQLLEKRRARTLPARPKVPVSHGHESVVHAKRHSGPPDAETVETVPNDGAHPGLAAPALISAAERARVRGPLHATSLGEMGRAYPRKVLARLREKGGCLRWPTTLSPSGSKPTGSSSVDRVPNTLTDAKNAESTSSQRNWEGLVVAGSKLLPVFPMSRGAQFHYQRVKAASTRAILNRQSGLIQRMHLVLRLR